MKQEHTTAVSSSGRPRRIWLDVAFEEKEEAKTHGARWDPAARRWYLPEGLPTGPVARWIPLRLPRTGPQAGIEVLGMHSACWRCGSPTTVIIGVTVEGFPEIICFDAPRVKQLAQALVTSEVRQRFAIGALRRRFSKTAGEAYVSNGCFSCDALKGDFMILHEEYMLREDDEDIFPVVASTIPQDLRDELVKDFEPDEAEYEE